MPRRDVTEKILVTLRLNFRAAARQTNRANEAIRTKLQGGLFKLPALAQNSAVLPSVLHLFQIGRQHERCMGPRFG